LVVLELLCQSTLPLSELVAPFCRFAASGEINTVVTSPATSVAAITERVRALGASVDELDGLTADFGDWWFNLRPSNTEPLLRLNVEAATEEEVARHVAAVRALIAEVEVGA
jgi:phosphomannomutase